MTTGSAPSSQPPRRLAARPVLAGATQLRLNAARRAATSVGFVFLFLLPFAVTNGYALRVLSIGWLYGILAMGVVTSYGYLGIPNMSQGALFGIGAYAGANFLAHVDHMPFLVAALLGGLVAASAGALLGLTTLRLRGNLWWLVTIAFSEMMFIVFGSWNRVTGGESGFVGIPLASIGSYSLKTNESFYYLALGALAIVYAIYARILNARTGLAMRAVAFDELGARGLGLSDGALKITGVALAGFGAGVAGVCLDAITGYIDAGSFDVEFSFNILIFAVVGGLYSLRGSIVASAALTYLTTEVSSLVNYQLFIFGGVVLLALFIRLYGGARMLSSLLGRRGNETVELSSIAVSGTSTPETALADPPGSP